jgi:RES domain-containing protein
MMSCGTCDRSKPAWQDDSQGGRPCYRLPYAHAQMGVGAKGGAGAAEQGGRVNRPGTHALYLALDPETARREYQQLSQLMPPGRW